jgi:mRNA interferase HigB
MYHEFDPSGAVCKLPDSVWSHNQRLIFSIARVKVASSFLILFPYWERAIVRRKMRIIARNTLIGFWRNHPEARVPLERWYKLVSAASWRSTDEVQKAAPRVKVLNGDRIRFAIAGGDYRLVAAFDFRRQTVFVKFIGTHAEYDRIDALTVSQF